jgi:hypothetical protein
VPAVNVFAEKFSMMPMSRFEACVVDVVNPESIVVAAVKNVLSVLSAVPEEIPVYSST